MKTIEKKVKGLWPKDNGRSADFVTPSFIFNCAGTCTYCYVHRHNTETIEVGKNIYDIFKGVNDHIKQYRWPKIPNQCDPIYYTYDIGENTDISLHWKQQNWEEIFRFFINNYRIKATFATKYVRKEMLGISPGGKVRIRFSVMPQNISNILEPDADYIVDRLKAVDEFQAAGYEVHLNISPVIVKDGWLDEYKILFEQINDLIKDKEKVKSEVIFLTHNIKLHNWNIENGVKGEELLWTPENQEDKISLRGGKNVRYEYRKKRKYIEEFKKLYNEHLPWCKIRYIF